MELKDNQAALILELSDEGEMTVHIEFSVIGGVPEEYCRKIAEKLLFDDNFRASLNESELEDTIN